jgi:uncharacterized protein DUF4157
MATFEDRTHVQRPRRSAATPSARGPEPPTQDERRPGAAAQLAAVHRTLRHGSALQLEAGGAAAGGRHAAAARPAGANRTGLPDRLKSGVEALSGLSLDDVRVHRNSAKPAELQALAYTQGTDIHVAPGEEKHLPHEAWHAVQQKQGRVKPTLQMKGVPINDDAGLEREADLKGLRALRVGAPASGRSAAGAAGAAPVAQAIKRQGVKLGVQLSNTFKGKHVAGTESEAKSLYNSRDPVAVNTSATAGNWRSAIQDVTTYADNVAITLSGGTTAKQADGSLKYTANAALKRNVDLSLKNRDTTVSPGHVS